MLKILFKIKLFSFLKPIMGYFLIKKNPICRIEEIDLINNLIIVYCRGIDAPIKLSFEEIIHDSAMLSNFSPKHASWIGYYYGRYSELDNKNYHSTIPFEFPQNKLIDKHNITMLTRQGDVVYTNNSTKDAHTMNPIRIMLNKSLISQFEPIQACYIGILSGLSNKKKSLRKSPSCPINTELKLVK